jgi:hypothetical protein
MSDEAWHQRYLHLRCIRQQTGRARVDPPGHPEALRDWLEHQKALGALGAYHLLLYLSLHWEDLKLKDDSALARGSSWLCQ